MLDAQKLILVASLLTATVTHATCSSECVPPRKKFAEDHCACADDFPIRAPATGELSARRSPLSVAATRVQPPRPREARACIMYAVH